MHLVGAFNYSQDDISNVSGFNSTPDIISDQKMGLFAVVRWTQGIKGSLNGLKARNLESNGLCTHRRRHQFFHVSCFMFHKNRDTKAEDKMHLAELVIGHFIQLGVFPVVSCSYVYLLFVYLSVTNEICWAHTLSIPIVSRREAFT